MFTVLVVGFGLLSGLAQRSTGAPVGTAFTYQGRLIDANSAADGLYDFRFELYSDPCLSLAAYKVGKTITVDDMDVVDGYFTAELDFGSWGVFTGDARWLQIAVAPDGMIDPPPYTILSPRQRITPTRPGVPVPLSLSTSSPNPVISGTNTGSGHAIYGRVTDPGDSENYAGYFEAAGEGSVGVGGIATGEYGRGTYGLATGNFGRGIYGLASNNANVANYGGYFKTRGEQGRGVYGEASNTGSTTNYGGYFKAAGKYGRAVYAEGTGESSRGVWGETSGKYGIGVQGNASGENSYAVYGYASGASGRGVYGSASKTGAVKNYGGYFVAAGDEGRAVYGKATAVGVGLLRNYGGYFETAGLMGIGVLGEATSGAGVGVRGRGLGLGIGVMGEAPDEGAGTNVGGHFKAAGVKGRGVYAEASGVNGIGVAACGKLYDFYAAGDGIDYGAESSIRWKTDISSIDDPLGKVMNLRGVSFNWDAEHGGGHDVGMIAEEVGEVLPEIVSYEENGIDATGMDYSKLTPLLVEAVKVLKEQADERESHLAQQEVEIAELKVRLSRLEALMGKPALRQKADI